MEFNLLSKIAQILRSQQQRSRWRRVVTCMAAVVVFCTTYALILPAITLTASCGLEEHTHTAACYANDDTLLWLCQQENQAAAVHQHDEACYDENGLLVCGKADFVLHTHDADTCYDAEGNLICTLPEITAYSRTTLFLAKAEDSATATTSSSLQFALFIPEGAEDTDSALPDGYVVLDSQEPEAWTEAHTHSADCYDENGKLICGQLEVAQHQHTMDCLQGTLICGLEEHQHSQACYTDAQNADQADQQALTAQVDDATIGVTFPADALPEGVILQAREIAQDSDDYAVYYQQALQAMQNQSETEVTLSFARFFDIAFLADGTEVEPAAPVDVTITYADGIALADNENSSAIHFTDDDIQVLEVQTEGVGDTVDTFTFTQDSFSVTGTVVAANTSGTEAQELEVLVGETITITGSSANSHSWSSSDATIAKVTGNSKEATVTGMKAGTVTITHKYGAKKNNLDSEEQFTVTVVEVMKEAAGANFTVKVTGNKNALPEGVTLMVEEVDASYEDDAYYNTMIDGLNAAGAATTTLQSGSDHAATDFDFLHMYHIWLQQADGEEYVLNENANLNLNVTITYTDTDTEAPAGWDSLQAKGAWVGHYYKKENGAIAPKSIDDSLEPKQVKVKGSSISFHMKSFSVITMATAAAATIETEGETGIPDYIGTINSGNRWQIVSGEYKGNAQIYKTAFPETSSDPEVYLQKNVVPTGTENEFLVYLSVDKKISLGEIFDAMGMVITSSNGYSPGDIGGLKGNSTYLYTTAEEAKKAGINSPNEYHPTIYVKKDGNVIYTYKGTRYGSTPNCSNGSVLMQLPGLDGWYALQSGVTLKNGNGIGSGGEFSLTLDLDEDNSGRFSGYSTYDTIFDSVTDKMGDYIVFEKVIGCDGTYSIENGILIWTPIDNQTVIAGMDVSEGDYWIKNVIQLVYKVKLDVEKDGFNSCAAPESNKEESTHYQVNTEAKLQYTKSKETTYEVDGGKEVTTSEEMKASAEFPIPEVRGLLYDIAFKKVDGEGNLVENAEFVLYKADGTEIGKITTNKTEKFNYFRNLPYGTYILEESASPEGYTAETKKWSITLCYTTDKDELKASTNEVNMIWAGNDDKETGCWEIVNKKSEQSVILKKVSATDSAIPLAGAKFILYQVDENGAKIANTAIDDLTSDTNGVFSPADFTLQTGTYYLEETKAPDGYHMLTEPVVITVNGAGVNAYPKDNSIAQLEVESTANDGVTTYTVLVTNSSGTALPETGGYGPEAYQLAGLLLMLIAAGWLWQRLRERGNAHSPKA